MNFRKQNNNKLQNLVNKIKERASGVSGTDAAAYALGAGAGGMGGYGFYKMVGGDSKAGALLASLLGAGIGASGAHLALANKGSAPVPQVTVNEAPTKLIYKINQPRRVPYGPAALSGAVRGAGPGAAIGAPLGLIGGGFSLKGGLAGAGVGGAIGAGVGTGIALLAAGLSNWKNDPKKQWQ